MIAMKLMFYINTISHGGAERVLVNLANQLSNRGHECVFVTSFRCPNFEYALNEDVKRISMSNVRIQNSFVRNIKYVTCLRRQINKYAPDVLVAFMPEANYRALIATIGISVKTIISVRNDPNREYGSRIGKLLAKHLYKLADGIVFQTEQARSWFPKQIQKKGEIIFNQVDNRFYKTSLAIDKTHIVATGRLSRQKNHQMLINAYAKISETTDESLLIYGTGILHETLQNQINDYHLENKVMLMGNTSDVPKVLKTAKLYIMSSDYEGMPNALMEAMAMGIPCISTDCPCGGPRMLFGEELKDCLVPVNDVAALAEKLNWLINNDAKREEVGKLCKEKAAQFRPDIIIKKWEEYIKKVVVDRKS